MTARPTPPHFTRLPPSFADLEDSVGVAAKHPLLRSPSARIKTQPRFIRLMQQMKWLD